MKIMWKAAATADGKLDTIDCESFIDAGCSEDFSGFILGEMLENLDSCYQVENYRSKCHLLLTNTASNTAVRAPGLIQALAVTENIMESIAGAVGVSVEEIRKINMMTSEKCDTAVKDVAIAHYNLPNIWGQLEDSSEFEARKAAVDEFNAQNKWRKRGISMVPMRYGLGHGHVAGSNVTINVHATDGSIEVFHSGQEMGQGITTKILVTISMALGVPIDSIFVHGTNTSVIPNGAGIPHNMDFPPKTWP